MSFINELAAVDLSKWDEKPHLTVLTKPAEIESAMRNQYQDIVAVYNGGVWLAYPWSLKAWRDRQANGA